MDSMTHRIYWTTTILFGVGMVGAGIQELRHAPELLEGAVGLGYPGYLLTILGAAKLLGVPLLVAPQFRVLKEWAYAGFTFDLLGALVSHLVVGDPVERTAPSAVFLGVLAISYATHRSLHADRYRTWPERPSTSDTLPNLEENR